jgi:hypothetical protein
MSNALDSHFQLLSTVILNYSGQSFSVTLDSNSQLLSTGILSYSLK